jgi:DNA ligase-associated metallophosphoesterase
MKVELAGEPVVMMPEKALYLPNQKTVLVADLHLGKVNHFRKAGIAVPPRANDKNTTLLIEAINRTKPDRVIFLGDLFHSHYNDEWESFGQIRKHFTECSFELVMGNHDILGAHQYQQKSLQVYPQELKIGPWILTHEPLKEISTDGYNLAGHIHPGVYLKGTARQSLLLPCFYFGAKQGILPAFGSFTGLARVLPKKNEHVYAIAENRILKIA